MNDPHIDPIPLCVDLDGTLTATDTLFESVISALKSNLLLFFVMPFWLLRGKIYLKNKLGDYAVPNIELLPFYPPVIDYIKNEKAKGRKIILATATIQKIAERTAEHLGLFDEVYASSRTLNLLSTNKAELLTAKFGKKGYDYIGDSKRDFPVWESARKAVVVSSGESFPEKVSVINPQTESIKVQKKSAKHFIKQIRVYQWVKNILLFLPVLMAHKFDNYADYLSALLAFFSFGFAASFVYVLNDLFDMDSDRAHPRKCKRPLASGTFSIKRAFFVLPMLILSSAFIAFEFLPIKFTAALGVYLLLTGAYTLVLKKIYIVDVFVLASLYSLRLFAGALAVDVPISTWLLEFSMFLFISMAFVKRYTELLVMKEADKKSVKGRGYMVDDIGLIRSLGPASGYLSVLVFAFYLNSQEVLRLYKHPEYLWPVAICIMFWLTRIWFLAHRGRMTDDPIVFAGKDPVSYLTWLTALLLVIGAAL